MRRRLSASILLFSFAFSPGPSWAETAREKTPSSASTASPEAVQQTFLKGKAFYEAGDVEAAIRTWETLDPYLDAYPSIRKVIAYLKAQATAPPGASAKTDSAEISAVLENAAEQMAARRDEARRAQEALSHNTPARAGWIEETFQKGRAAADEGDWATAIENWDRLGSHLDESAPERTLIEALKRDYFTSEKLRSETRRLLEDSRQKIKTPRGFSDTLEAARARLRADLTQAEDEAGAAGKARSEREAWVDAALVRARAAYEEGRIEPAIVEWEKTLPYLENEAELREKIKTLRENLKTLQDIRSQSEGAVAGSFEKLKVPLGDRLTAEIARATDILRARAGRALEEQGGVQKSLAEREEWIAAQFEKGKRLIGEGRIADALAEWEPIMPNVDGGDEFRAQFDRLRADARAAKEAEEAAAAGKDAGTARLKAPAELSDLLERAAKELSKRREESDSRLKETENASLKRRKEISEAFEKGRSYYVQGKYWEASSAWKALLPYVEESPQIEKWIGQFETAYHDYLESKNAVDRLMDERSRRYAAPADLVKLLAQAQRDVEAQTAALVAERASMEKGLAEHEAWVRDAFRKGKALYDQGRTDPAIGEWEKLLPHLDETSPERALILGLRSGRDAAAAARQKIQDLAASDQGRVPAPPDLKLVLEAAIDATHAKQRELELERQAVERSIRERHDAMLGILQSGKDAFEAGRLEEALAEWKKLLEYVDNRSNLNSALQKADAVFHAYRETRQKLSEAQSRGGQRFEPPQQLDVALQSILDRIAAATAAARAEQSSLEKDFTSRKLWTEQTYQAGKQHYAAGRMEEAVDEWSKLAPYLPEDTGLPAKLAQIKAVKDEAVRAKKEAVETAARQYKGLRIESNMESFLADISKDLKTQTVQSEKDRARAEEELASKQKKVDAAAKEAKALYDSGDLSAAVGSWSGVLPYLDETSDAHRRIVDLRARYDELVKMLRAAEDSRKKAGAPAAPPADFERLLDEARKKIAAQAQAAEIELQKAQAASRERDKSVSAAYQSAKDKMWSGDLSGAVQGWKALAPRLEGAAPLVQSFETELAAADKAQKDAASAAAKAAEKPPAPPDFAQDIESARQKIRAQIQAMADQTAKSQAELAARRQSVNQAFDRGKSLYWNGKVADALKEWQAVAASVDDKDAAQAFAELQKAQERLLQAQSDAAAAAEQASGKFAAPAELSKILALAIEKTRAQSDAAKAEKARLVEDLEARRAKAEQAYRQGASDAAAGKYAEAVSSWRTLLPLLDAQSTLAPLLNELEKAIADAESARQSADTYAAGEFKDIQFRHGGEIEKIVSSAQGRLKAQTLDAQKRKADMEKTLADRRAWVEATFQKGKTLFEAGGYTEASEFWKSLAPYLVDGPRVTAMLEEFERLRIETASAVASAAEAESKKDTRYSAPAEVAPLLAAATEKIKAAQFDARTRREKVEQELSARRVSIQQAFDKGKAAYEKGSLPMALEEWAGMLPLVENEAQVRDALDAVRKAYEESVLSRREADAAEARKNDRQAPPAELKAVVDSVTGRLAKEIQAADTRRALMEKAISDRKAFVQNLFDRGKALYDEGKLPEAFELWKTMGPYIEDAEKLDASLSKAGQAYQGFVGAKSAYHEAALLQSAKQKTPPELSALIEDAAAKLKQEDFDSRNKSFEIEKSISDRREWINSAFKKGQSLYLEGRLPEALAEWNTLLPYLEDGLDVKAKLVEIEKSAALAEKSRRILEESRSKAKLQFQSPEELGELLLKADEDLKNRMFAASAEKAKAEQTLSERRKWMSQTFDLGRSFYAEGKIEEAVAEWQKLKPYLEGQPAIAEMMDTLQKNFTALQDAKRAAVEAAAEDYKGLKLTYSDQMTKVLEAAVKKIGDETFSLREKLDKTHELLAERKEWSVTTFNKGKVLYEDGRYAEALEQWERLLPYLEDGSSLRLLIQGFRKSYDEWADRSSAIGDLEKRKEKPVQLASPETMMVTLKEAADKMKAQAEAAEARAADLEKALSDRKSWIEYTYQKGRELFDQGHYAEAVGEWGVLGPYLSEHPPVREQIEEAKRGYVQFRKADQILRNAETKKAALAPLPEGARVPAPAAPAAVAEEPVTSDAAPARETPAQTPDEPPAEAAAETQTPDAPPQEELVTGEVLTADKDASILRLKLVSDGSELDVRYDGATQFDGAQPRVNVDSIQEGASVDVRVDKGTGRASYIYLY